ncbi:MAG: Rpn family recombination-promoting nuclease/putative transposase [Treponema sp.]|nr:Rpn family recombination-promoting nuclease/putative transposase [Treponema sp.]
MAKIRFDENDDPINICYDNVFKAVFTRNTPESQGALSRLITALIGRTVSVVTVTANEPATENLNERRIRFDIACKTEKQEPVNIEMSLNPTPYEPVRMEYHIGKLFTSQDIHGSDKDYKDLKEAYQIAFLVKERFFPDDTFFHEFAYYDSERGVSLNGRSRIITLELSKLDKVVEKPTAAMTAAELWAVYFRYLQDASKRQKINEILEHEEGIAMASEVLMTISRDEVERARLVSEFKGEVDLRSHVNHAKREIAQKMIDMGLSTEQIVRATGLSKEQIEDL